MSSVSRGDSSWAESRGVRSKVWGRCGTRKSHKSRPYICAGFVVEGAGYGTDLVRGRTTKIVPTSRHERASLPNYQSPNYLIPLCLST